MRGLILLAGLFVAWPVQADWKISTASPEDHTMARAGLPRQTSRLAIPSIEKHEGEGLIGGGRLIHADAPRPSEGTFGWDYQGLGHFPGRVFLGWSHARRLQPPEALYRTDGPGFFEVLRARKRFTFDE